jgi:23S rRNA pseudouridine1911/1915/1917 synthase
MEPTALYEDDEILVLNKPAGWVVNRAESVKGETVQDWVERRNPVTKTINPSPIEEVFWMRSGIAHRLDKDTSGVLMVAKNPERLADLMDAFQKREVSKQYLALVWGKLEPIQGNITLPLARSGFDRHQFKVDVMGKHAETDYEVQDYYHDADGSEYSLVSLRPKTGRTHQIRVHLKHIKHPIVGDLVYGGSRAVKLDRRWCKRQFLHAYAIEFPGTMGLKQRYFEANLATDLVMSLRTLTKI